MVLLANRGCGSYFEPGDTIPFCSVHDYQLHSFVMMNQRPCDAGLLHYARVQKAESPLITLLITPKQLLPRL